MAQTTGSTTKAVLLSLVSAVVGALIAYAFIPVANRFRVMSTMGVFDERRDVPGPTGGAALLMIVALVAAVVLRWVVSRSVATVEGRVGTVLRVTPFGTLGALVVCLFAASMMTAPTTVGWDEDPVFGQREAWDATGWAFYSLPVAAPVVLGLIAVIRIGYGIASARSTRRRTSPVTGGLRASGRITQVSGAAEVQGSLLTVSVDFTDHTGMTRHVTTQRPAMPGQQLQAGQPVVVFYDPVDHTKVTFGLAAATPTASH
ncbi:DUF3592 domain-containing protein [Cellulomonas sp. NPDC089187]|uniref:DUF3592 domain-containing protein n=1 Tax=Cellulomonas sp. NPDC089187 TaxID=3154970 RepID=UPI00341CACF0